MIWMLSQHLVVCGLLAVVVGIVCRLFALSPATRHTLWLIVLIKVLLPLPVTWPWGIPSPTALFAKPVSIPAAPSSGSPAIEIPRMPQELIAATNNAPAQAAPTKVDAKPSWITAVWGWLNVSRAAALAWVLLSVGIIGAQLINHARFRRRMRSHVSAPEWLADGVVDIAKRLGIKTPDVHVVDGAPSPCVYGLYKTKLIIPEALLKAVSRERWDCILTHELAHLKRRDHIVRWIELITGGIWFWNPVYWIARRNMRANAELACDAWVVWALPEQRRVYAETLIDVSELIAKSPQPIAALGMGTRGVRLDFEHRLKMILHERNAQHMTWKAGAYAGLLALLAMPGWSQDRAPAVPAVDKQEKAQEFNSAKEPKPQPKNGNAFETALKSPVTIEFNDQHITKIVGFLSEVLGVNIVVDQGAVKPATSDGSQLQWGIDNVKDRVYASDGMLKPADVEATRGDEVLDEWMKQLNLTYLLVEGRIFISSKKQVQEDGNLYSSMLPTAVPDLFMRVASEPFEWTFENEHIATAASKLSRKIRLPIVVDARVVAPSQKNVPPNPFYAVPIATPPAAADRDIDLQYASDGIVRNIRLTDVPLDAALKALTEQLNLTYGIKGNCIWITSPARLATQEFQYPAVPEGAEELSKALDAPINIEFEKQHVTKILDFIREFLKINIIVDQRALPAMVDGRQVNPPYLTKVNDKYVATGYVSYIKLENMPLKDALNALLVPIGLTYRVDRNAIFVTTPEYVEARSEVAAVNNQSGAAESKMTKALNAPISIEFEAQHISKILAFISDYLDVNLAIDFRAIKPVQNTAGVARQPGLPALPPGPGAPSPAPGVAPPIIPPPVAKLDVPIDPVLDAMYVTDGMVPDIKLQNLPMKDALNALLEPLNLAYEVHPNYIWITAKERIGKDDWSDPPVPADAQALVTKLNSPIALEFERQHIVTSLAFAAKYLNIAIKYDARAVPPLSDGVSYFEAKDGKPVSTGMFPYARLKDVPFKEVLKTLLTPMGLIYRVTPDAIVITSPELAQNTKPEEWADIPFLSEEKPTDSAAVVPPHVAPAPPQAAATSPRNVPMAATNVKLIRIVKWSNGTYRAEIQSGLSDRARYYKPGEAFEVYKLMSIDPEKNAVTIYSSALDKTFELQPVPSS